MSRARLADVAARAGVSTATASLVLRDQPGPSARARQAVQAAAQSLDYRPDRTASLLARRRSRLIGVLLDVASPFHAELVDRLDAAAAEHGYDLVLSTVTSRRSQWRAVETLVDFRCEGLVLLGATLPAPRLTDLGRTCATVVVGRPGGESFDGVLAADDQGMAVAVDHLVGLGHRRIAYVDGPKGTIASARRRGYREAMRRHRLADATEVLPGGDDEAAGVTAGERVAQAGGANGSGAADRQRAAERHRAAERQRAANAPHAAERPTALIAFNDRCAVGVRDALLRHGLDVPGDVSLVGYDDSPLARLATVGLTSVSQDPPALAAAAMRALTARLDGGPDDRGAAQVVVAPRLVVRDSTAPPARAG